MQGCCLIWEFKENQGILCSTWEIRGNRRIFRKIEENQGSFNCGIVLFQSNDFLHTQSHIQLSVAIANFFPFEYHSVLCSPYEAQFLFHKAKNSNGEE